MPTLPPDPELDELEDLAPSVSHREDRGPGAAGPGESNRPGDAEMSANGAAPASAPPADPGTGVGSVLEAPGGSELDATGNASIPESTIKRARILIVDDDQAVLTFLERVLTKHGFVRVTCAADPRRALEVFEADPPDLLVLDLRMPAMDGFDLLGALKPHITGAEFLPTLILTGDLSQETRRKALAAGAKDFLTKPVDYLELLLRISNLLENRFLHLRLRQQNASLEAQVQQRTRELEDARIETLERLARTAEYRDDNTRWHTERVGIRSALLARALGLPQEQVQLIRRAAPLHDLGKIGIPDSILLKPARLTPEEVAVMRTHTTIGAQILSGSRFKLLNLAAEIALTHHERWDGTGYPQSLKGEDIPLASRIVAVADFFDALAHDRPYRPAWDIDDITAEIARQRGRQFDPRVADAFLDQLCSAEDSPIPLVAGGRAAT